MFGLFLAPPSLPQNLTQRSLAPGLEWLEAILLSEAYQEMGTHRLLLYSIKMPEGEASNTNKHILFNYLIYAYGLRSYSRPISSPIPLRSILHYHPLATTFSFFYSTQNQVYVVYIFIVWDHPLKHDSSTKGYTLKKKKQNLTLHPSKVNCQHFLNSRR